MKPTGTSSVLATHALESALKPKAAKENQGCTTGFQELNRQSDGVNKSPAISSSRISATQRKLDKFTEKFNKPIKRQNEL